jgi:hypothetical protein
MPRLVFNTNGARDRQIVVYDDDGGIAAYGHLEIDAILGGPGTRIGDLVFVIDEGGQPPTDRSALQREAADVGNVQ